MARYSQSYQPPPSLGIDFGDAFIVLGRGGQGDRDFQILELPGLSQQIPGTGTYGPVYGIPVVLRYTPEGTISIGDEIERAGQSGDRATARWIRDYLLGESQVQIPAGRDTYKPIRSVAEDLLGSILTIAGNQYPRPGSLVFAVPPGAPARYGEWLCSTARAALPVPCSWISEQDAVLAGYDIYIADGEEILIIHCNETILDISIVRRSRTDEPSSEGRVQVLGQSRTDTGCLILDTWITEGILARILPKWRQTVTRRISPDIREKIRTICGRLAMEGEILLDLSDVAPGMKEPIRISREEMSRIISGYGFPAILEQAVHRAQAAARSRGGEDKPPAAVLLVGRGCAIPAVQDCICELFRGIPVKGDHPCDAIARGAARFIFHTKEPDRIRNDYALRYRDPDSGEYRYRYLVRRGARFPSAGQAARIRISAAYDGQTRLGIPLYEIRAGPGISGPAIELVSDPAGGVRIAGPNEDAAHECRPVLVNGKTPVLLSADPPALKGEPRFELTFTLDREKRLCVTARDLITGRLVKREEPIHRLT